jgi:hypothetical protein
MLLVSGIELEDEGLVCPRRKRVPRNAARDGGNTESGVVEEITGGNEDEAETGVAEGLIVVGTRVGDCVGIFVGIIVVITKEGTAVGTAVVVEIAVAVVVGLEVG